MRASTAKAIALPEFEISTVQDMGWTDVTMEHWLLWRKVNSTYSLRRISLRHQQNLTGRRLAIIELPTNQVPLSPS